LNGLSVPVSRSFVAVIVVLAFVFAAVARDYYQRYQLSLAAAIAIYLAFILLLALSLPPAWHSGAGKDRPRRQLLAVLPLIWCCPYFVYAAGTGDFRWTALVKLLILAASLATIYSSFPPQNLRRFSWQDACVAVTLAGFVLSGQLRGIWNVPVNLDFMSRLFLIAAASWSWTFVRLVPGLGYSFRVSAEVLKQAAINFFLFAVIAIPASLAMHFTSWNPRWPGIAEFLLDYVEIFLFIALLEELFFRGFLQSLLSENFRSRVAAQAVVSVLFGLFHILHDPFPNWRYVALASVAGWFYGSAFRISGSIFASSLVHAAVDTVWRTWFLAR
jgi:membrane protease YdiL (CAAX protease family)